MYALPKGFAGQANALQAGTRLLSTCMHLPKLCAASPCLRAQRHSNSYSQEALQSHSRRRASSAVSSAAADVPLHSSKTQTPRLVLYSKPDCELCHGLKLQGQLADLWREHRTATVSAKDKVDGILEKAKWMPSPLTGAQLEVRDITTKEEWERQYGMVIPVLTVTLPGSITEIKVKRVPPKSAGDRVAKYILAAMESKESADVSSY